MFDCALIVLPAPFLKEQKRNSPLGVLYLAAVLKRSQIDSIVVDLREIPEKRWLDHIPGAHCFGISATSVEFPMASRLAMRLKARGAPVILGGVHATVAPTNGPFDAIVKGEAEEIIGSVVKYPKGAYLGTFPKLDQLPLPARELLPLDAWANYEIVRGYFGTTIIGSRGCPYKCAYCSSPAIYGRRVRFRSPKLIAQEIAYLKINYGIAGFRFHDDLLTLKLSWLEELCQEIAPLGIVFRCNARVDTLTPEKCWMLKAAGCKDLGLGVESVHQPTLEAIHKGQTVEQAKQAIELCHQFGIRSRVFLIMGLPLDFGDLSGRTIQFLEETEPDGVDLNSLVPLPGSGLFNCPEKYGLRFRENFSLGNLGMLKGLEDDEWKDDFVIEYPGGISNKELKYHRKVVLDYLASRKLEVDD